MFGQDTNLASVRKTPGIALVSVSHGVYVAIIGTEALLEKKALGETPERAALWSLHCSFPCQPWASVTKSVIHDCLALAMC